MRCSGLVREYIRREYSLPEILTGIYIHFPFCVSKCPYCDFFSVVLGSSGRDSKVLLFLEEIVKELHHLSRIFPIFSESEKRNDKAAWTVYLGGGTPSLGGKVLAEKLSIHRIQSIFSFKSVPEEATFEVNPESRTDMLFFRESGYQRASVGVQSLKDDLLKVLGRVHSAAEAMEAIELALKIFPRVSADLIYGIPGQKPEDFYRDIEKLVDAGISHISIYPLTISEENKTFRYELPPKELVREMYTTAHEILTSRGFVHYEISNFSRGKENVSLHNLNYWLGGNYLGFGPSAHSRYAMMRWENSPFLEDEGAKAFRWRVSKIYCDCNDVNRERLDLFLLMRIGAWIPSSCFDERVLGDLAEGDFLELADGRFRITPLGWFSYNRVFEILAGFGK